MKGYFVKLPDRDAEEFEKICKKKGKSCYSIIRELIYKFIAENGGKITTPPDSLQIMLMQERLTKIEERLRRIEEIIFREKRSGLDKLLYKK